MSVAVNPPKTPVHEGSSDIAAATLPNVCKMPGPPAPFVPTPLPNIGKSGDSLKKGTTKVLIEGNKVAIEGSYYMSGLSGDMASKGTGGGLLNSSTEGKTEFTAPGSMNVKAEGKNIQLLGDAMTNNGSNPTNGSGTLPGNVQAPQTPADFALAVGQANADALCKAACDAIKKKTKKNKYQNLMRKALDQKNNKGVRGVGRGTSSGASSGVLTEVAQEVKGGLAKFVGKWGTQVASGPFVKWDVLLTVTNPAPGLGKLADMTQVEKIVEVKFPGDSPTDNQTKMLKSMSRADRDKIVEMDPAKCCDCSKFP